MESEDGRAPGMSRRHPSAVLLRRRWLRRFIPIIQFGIDASVWAIAFPLTTLLRYDFEVSQLSASGLTASILLAITGQAAWGYLSGLYVRTYRYGSFDELLALAATVFFSGGLVAVVTWTTNGSTMPRSVPLLATFATMTGAVALRSLWRLYLEAHNRPLRAQPVVVAGAGEGGDHIIRTLLNDPQSRLRPVALVCLRASGPVLLLAKRQSRRTGPALCLAAALPGRSTRKAASHPRSHPTPAGTPGYIRRPLCP